MKIRDFILSLVSWFILLVTVSCSDELGGERPPISSESNLHVLVPTVLSSRGTRADDASGLPTYNATVDECQINDLTLYAFPVPTGNGNDGKLLVETLPAPLATMMAEPNVANYQLNIEPGTYHIYVVANMNKVLSGKTIQTENDLKTTVLNYGVGGGEPGMPVSTNIPMIYEPKDINGKTLVTEIKATDKSATVFANLKFTCVKVKLNLIFDPAVATVFSGNSFLIKNILAQQLTPKTSLCWDGKFSQSEVSKEYADGFESYQYDAANNRNGLYYLDGEWTRNDANANINDQDVITLKEGVKGKDKLTNAAAKWLFQGTYYLPERYIANASQQSRLAIEGSINGNNDNKYIIPLGHKQDESSTTELPTFPRGTYYEIIGNIKSLGNITLDGKTFIKPWEPMSIDADFSHTTLWLDKTKAKLTSLTNDSIFYKTNAAAVEFGCDKKISVDGKDKDFIIATKTYNDRIIFTINPAIPYTAYSATEREGKAKIWVKANNLIKYLDVEYNIQPLFEVDPLETTIFYEAGAETNTKKFTWVTNLGGIVIDKYKSTVGSSNITIKLENSDTDAKGTISVKAENNPTTTVEHYFKAYSKKPVDGKYIERTIKVVVKPPFGDYYIYFRAINDRKYNDAKYEGTLDENVDVSGGNYNWNDGWLQNKGSNAINVDHHNLYMYYQYGESNGTDNIPEENVWYFTGYYTNPGGNGPAERNSRMTGAANNPGWYYYKIPKDAKGHNNHNKADREIKPGETLMIFYSYNNDGPEYHRCPHHMEPGIPLFNYEDHEGWILYDPTSDPTYRIFDERPEVENVTYTVYSPYEIKRWSCNFGISNNKLTEQWTLYDEVGTESNGSMTFSEETIGGKKWYVTKIKLKAVKGYHEKTILIQNNSGDTNESKVLFGGRSYEKYGDTGWIERKGGGIVAWHPGVPNSGDWTDDNGNKQ